jgi:hypothetical protein
MADVFLPMPGRPGEAVEHPLNALMLGPTVCCCGAVADGTRLCGIGICDEARATFKSTGSAPCVPDIRTVRPRGPTLTANTVGGVQCANAEDIRLPRATHHRPTLPQRTLHRIILGLNEEPPLPCM